MDLLINKNCAEEHHIGNLSNQKSIRITSKKKRFFK